MSTLAQEVAKFRQWAAARQAPENFPGELSHGEGEWECDYADWQALYAAVEDLLAVAVHRTLTGEERSGTAPPDREHSTTEHV